jgi:4-carboxymuconolactone decarboxylase
LSVGVPAEVIDSIKHRRDLAGLPPEDALLIQLVREMWRDHRVTSETFAAAKAHFGSKLLVHLVMLSGSYASTAALLCAFDMQLPDDEDVAVLPVP